MDLGRGKWKCGNWTAGSSLCIFISDLGTHVLYIFSRSHACPFKLKPIKPILSLVDFNPIPHPPINTFDSHAFSFQLDPVEERSISSFHAFDLSFHRWDNRSVGSLNDGPPSSRTRYIRTRNIMGSMPRFPSTRVSEYHRSSILRRWSKSRPRMFEWYTKKLRETSCERRAYQIHLAHRWRVSALFPEGIR